MAKQAYKITKEMILKVKRYLNEDAYNILTISEIASLVGVSATTVSRIKSGEYDGMLEEIPATIDGVTTVIPYEELHKLMVYEQIVREIIANTTLSTSAEDMLYFPKYITHNILTRYVPDLVQERLDVLNAETDTFA